ncbi:MAG: hypothetical protein WA949_11645 [Phormidesmis sp.]
MGTKLSQEKLAKALADADELGIVESSKRHGIDRKTISKYKNSLDPSSLLAAKVEQIRRKKSTDCLDGVPDAIRAGVATLEALASDPESNPRTIHALTKMVKELTETKLSHEMIRRRMG